MDAEPLSSMFTQAIVDQVDRFRDQGLTVAEAIGALELVKAQIIHDALNGEDLEEPRP